MRPLTHDNSDVKLRYSILVTSWKTGQMGEDAGPRPPSGAGDNNVTGPQDRYQAPPTRPPAGIAPPTRPPGEVLANRPPAAVTAAGVETGGDPGGVVRYGPGVPATPPESQAALTAQTVWQAGRLPRPSRRPARIRRLLGTALTVILLAASGVILYLRFHHTPFNVTGVAIQQLTHTACGVDVTGRITTNGAAGTVSYQWLNQPGGTAPQPLSQSVASGQKAVYVTVAIQGQGHGTASETVTLQVLGPDATSASTDVVISC
jgi:hypothetical protein